jgi:formyltetrahydrofolate deformylase
MRCNHACGAPCATHPKAQAAMSTPDPGRYVLKASCASRLGTVARIAGFLAERHCYIDEMQQFDDVMTQRFHLRCSFRPDADATPVLDALRREFSPLAAAEPLAWSMHDTHERLRVLIMVSKHDHCLEDLLYRWRTGELSMDIALVVSNHPDLRARVEREGLTFVHLPVTAETKAAQEQRLLELVAQSGSDLVVLARYMRILSDDLCAALQGRAINIHHSFLPGFKGAKPYHQAHARGVKLIGATAHYITADLDEGPIIEQVVQRVNHSFTPERLAAMGRDSERLALSRAMRLHVEHRLALDGERSIVFE